MNMTLEEAVLVLDGNTRKKELAKYENINEACNTAISLVLGALKDKGDLIFDAICHKNMEGNDDELVVIEVETLREIIKECLGVQV